MCERAVNGHVRRAAWCAWCCRLWRDELTDWCVTRIARRYGKFYRPDGSVVPVSEFDGGYGDETLNCAALLPGDQTKLKAIDCDAETVHKGVICQTPGHAHVRSGQWFMAPPTRHWTPRSVQRDVSLAQPTRLFRAV